MAAYVRKYDRTSAEKYDEFLAELGVNMLLRKAATASSPVFEVNINCFSIHKKLSKSCSFEKKFLFLKKKVVSLKKTKSCRIFKTNREIFLPIPSSNLYIILVWKIYSRSHGNFSICFGDFQQQCSVFSTKKRSSFRQIDNLISQLQRRRISTRQLIFGMIL